MSLQVRHQRISVINRCFVWILPLLGVAAVADITLWNGHLQKPLLPLEPSLESFKKPLPELPSLNLPQTLFHSIRSTNTVAAAASAPVVREVQWKLKGVLIGQAKRAFLQDSEGKSFWVTEGEQLGSFRIKQIKDRSVLIEKEGNGYEIRM